MPSSYLNKQWKKYLNLLVHTSKNQNLQKKLLIKLLFNRFIYYKFIAKKIHYNTPRMFVGRFGLYLAKTITQNIESMSL